jgi:hypothetical protein
MVTREGRALRFGHIVRMVAQLNRLTSSSRSAVNDSATFPPPLASMAACDGPAPIARDVLASTAPSFSTEGKSRSALRDLNGTCPVGFGASMHKAEDPTNSVGSMHPHVTVAGAGLRPWPLPPCAAVFSLKLGRHSVAAAAAADPVLPLGLRTAAPPPAQPTRRLTAGAHGRVRRCKSPSPP